MAFGLDEVRFANNVFRITSAFLRKLAFPPTLLPRIYLLSKMVTRRYSTLVINPVFSESRNWIVDF